MVKKSKFQNEIKTEYLLPVSVVACENAENADSMLSEHPRQAFLGKMEVMTLKKGGYAVFDFGEGLHGGADIVVHEVGADKNPQFRLVFGESVSEAMSTIGVNNATNDHSLRDFTIECTNWSHFIGGSTGFRFLKLEAVSCDINISSVQAVSRFRDLEYKGSFLTSDESLNEIWRVGAKTVHLNMQEYIWDGIKRDRLVWIGDMHPETETAMMVFGDTQVIRKSLDFVRDNTGPNEWMIFESYSMWWIKIHRDLYYDTGDKDYLSEQSEYLQAILKRVIENLDENGECTKNWSRFAEWSSHETPDEEAGFYAMLIIGLEAGAELLDILGINKTLRDRCREKIAAIKGLEFKKVTNKQIAAMTALCGLEQADEACEIILSGGVKGLSAFWGYYVLNVLAENGHMTEALNFIRDYWGAMIKLGATTFWEDFDADWAENASRIDEVPSSEKTDIHSTKGKFCFDRLRLSMCHGWASGPTSFLSRRVLGVIPVEPGYKRIRIEPQLGDLSFAEGNIPTPQGNIYVKHTVENGKIKTDMRLPEGVTLYNG